MTNTLISPTALISPQAQIGKNVSIGHCAQIEDDVIIGDNCQIDAFASVKRYTKLGQANHVHSYACVGGEPQDLKFCGEESWVEIGSYNSIREFSTIHRGTKDGNLLTKIGDHNLIMAYCHVAHDCTLGNHIIMSNGATLAGHVEVHDFAIISGLSAVHQFTRIGKYAFVGGMTGISQDLPPYMLAVGNRALVHGPNIVGLRRLSASREVLTALKNAFRLLWNSALPRQEAIEQIDYEYGQFAEIVEFLDFVRSSERGILPADN